LPGYQSSIRFAILSY